MNPRNRVWRIWAGIVVVALVATLLLGASAISFAAVDDDPVASNQIDTDGDGIINNEDTDIDGDGVVNGLDSDIDGDGIENFSDGDPSATNGFDSNPPSRPNTVFVSLGLDSLPNRIAVIIGLVTIAFASGLLLTRGRKTN
jgi:hypothetical protein